MSLDSDLFEAVRDGNLGRVKDLVINQDANVNDTDKDGWTSLHYAAWKGHLEITEFLVSNSSANINAIDTTTDGKKPIHVAALNGHKYVTEFFLDNQVSINDTDRNGWTPLHYAAFSGQLEVAKFLINEAAANINIQDIIDGKKPIHVAALNGHKDVVEFFLSKEGVSVENTDKNGWTPLYYAALRGHSGVVKYLIEEKCSSYGGNIFDAAKNGYLGIIKFFIDEKHVDANIRNKFNITPLHEAVFGGHLNSVRYLIDEKQVDINSTINGNQTALHISVASGNLEMVDFLLCRNADSNAVSSNCVPSGTPLHFAIHKGKMDIIKSLVSNHNINTEIIDDDGNIPLHLAVKDPSLLEVAELLIDKNVRSANVINKENWTPLHIAAKAGNLDAVKLLISKNAAIEGKTTKGWTPLHVAANEGELDVVTYLTDHGADIKAPNNGKLIPLDLAEQNNKTEVIKFFVRKFAEKEELTPLHWATEHKTLKVVELFADDNVNAQAENPYYYNGTPLCLAAEKGEVDIARFLITKGADVNATDSREWTPLHKAADGNKLEVAQLLLNNGTNVNAKNNKGWTPLHIAAKKGSLDIVKLLVRSNGIKIDAVSKTEKNTPLHVAAEAGQLEVVKLLKNNGATTKAINEYGKTPSDLAREADKTHVVQYLAQGRTRREIHTNVPVVRIADKNVGYDYPQIQHGQSNAIALPEINSTVVGNTAMLLELFARKLTGKKYAPSSEVPLSKDRYLEKKAEHIHQSLKDALSKFSQDIKDPHKPSTYLEDGLSVQSNVTKRQAR